MLLVVWLIFVYVLVCLDHVQFKLMNVPYILKLDIKEGHYIVCFCHINWVVEN